MYCANPIFARIDGEWIGALTDFVTLRQILARLGFLMIFILTEAALVKAVSKSTKKKSTLPGAFFRIA